MQYSPPVWGAFFSLSIKNGQATYIAPLQPPTLATFRSWGSSAGAGRIRLAHAAKVISFFVAAIIKGFTLYPLAAIENYDSGMLTLFKETNRIYTQNFNPAEHTLLAKIYQTMLKEYTFSFRA